MLRIIIMVLALIAVATVSNAAHIIPLNGKTTIEIFNILPLLFVPSNYVFLILPVLFIIFAFWIFGFWRETEQTTTATLKLRSFLFVLGAIFNLAWIILWHYEYFNWTVIVMIGLVATVAVLYFTYPKSENRFFQRIPISCYFGWIIFMLIANVNYVLTLHEWSGWGISTSLWTVIYLTIGAAIALHFMYHHRDIPLNIVIMWVYVGIAVQNGFDALFVSSASLFLTAVIGTSFFS